MISDAILLQTIQIFKYSTMSSKKKKVSISESHIVSSSA